MKITESTTECRKQNKGTITNRGDSVEHEVHGNGQSVSRIIEKDKSIPTNQQKRF